MKFLFLIALLVAATFAAFAPQKQATFKDRENKKLIDELRKTSYGTTLLKLVQLHSEAQGAVQELVEAIEELVSDLSIALEDLEFDYKRRTNEHNGLIITLEAEIQQADIDVQRSEDTLEGLLYPRRSQLSNRIAQLQENLEENRNTLAENTLIRAQEHEVYEQQVADLNSATDSVDEALDLISSLTNPSLLQVKLFQGSLNKLQTKINKRNKLAPMIKALITLASNQNFADQGSIRQIVDALNEFRNEIVDNLNQITLTELEAQEAFEERVIQLDLEHAEFQASILSVNQDLTVISDKIEEISNFRDQRAQDQKSFDQQLTLENSTYAEESEIYLELKNEHLKELAISEQALSVVQSVDFSNINVW